MGAVGGSRHYVGGGLGNESGWSCPSCGAENAGPIAQGCSLCGAGRPGYRAEAPPPPPPAAPPEPEPAAAGEINLAQLWIQRHPDATLEQAFTAGYIAGVKVTRQEVMAHLPEQRPSPMEMSTTPEDRMNRTIAAALELFRDQVLAGNPEEITTGEWMSVAEVNNLLRSLRAHIAQTEVAHA